jgi:hypothetical protein
MSCTVLAKIAKNYHIIVGVDIVIVQIGINIKILCVWVSTAIIASTSWNPKFEFKLAIYIYPCVHSLEWERSITDMRG